MNNELRKQVKLLKALQGINYAELAFYIEINKNSFYNWLNGNYELSEDTSKRLIDVINTLKE